MVQFVLPILVVVETLIQSEIVWSRDGGIKQLRFNGLEQFMQIKDQMLGIHKLKVEVEEHDGVNWGWGINNMFRMKGDSLAQHTN